MWLRSALVLAIVVAAMRVDAQPAGSGSDAGAGSGSAGSAAETAAPAEPVDHPVDQPKANASSTGAATKLDVPGGQPDAVSAATPHRDEPVAAPADAGFRFGSYGRVLAGTDLRGGKPAKLLIVAHGPRIVEDSYLELDFSYGLEAKQYDVELRPVITLAFDGTLFHDTGEFDAHPALRNMYLEAKGAAVPGLTLWAGSRMYRGDDIYLLDYWPLDDLNTVGAGASYRKELPAHDDEGKQRDAFEAAVHAGVNRLDNPFQFQQISVANPVQGATTVVQLNRLREIASGSLAYITNHGPSGLNVKVKAYGEVHSLGSGAFKRDDGTFEALPSDGGYLLGTELSLFGLAPRRETDSGTAPDLRYKRHLNLFMRYAAGLAAFDELAPPTTFGADLKTSKANEFTFGISGNWDHEFGNVMLGVLSRRFIDATGNTDDPNNGWEYAIDARPLAKLGRGFYAGGDISYQARFPNGLNPITLRAEDPALFQIAPMLVFSPMGPSGYDRPQLRFVLNAAHLNEGALDLYVPDDPRHARPWVYFLGVQAEWWFNSSTYKH